MSDVAADVIAIIAKKGKFDKAELKLTDRLDELGVDSLAAVEIMFDLEEKFDIQIPYNSNDTKMEFETVGEVIGAIEKLLGKS
jgi:acyl carrier protein